ncbi:uncharacterized protein [Gossypium hirsutum]|uniref:Uncharacterized protein n=1 Tax=Gossypium hirsutum TaxID=3635 RepID=A0A1U8MAQ3_GOSHI|nr:uncharacterized protein LOC107934706 [Gossypium hirsutum]
MAPYEALYARKCRTPLCWTELGELRVLGPELVSETEDKVKVLCRSEASKDRVFCGRLLFSQDLAMEEEEIEVRSDLKFEEEPVQILDRDVKVLRRKSIPLVKVLWRNHSIEEAI